jgi:hypothetical protein
VQPEQKGTPDPRRCQVCGERHALWVGPPMTDGLCPMTQERGLCEQARDKAHAAAMRRKVCPDAFDASGKILPDGLVRVIDAMEAAGLDPWTGRPA